MSEMLIQGATGHHSPRGQITNRGIQLIFFEGLVEGRGLPVGPSSSAALPVTIPAGVVPLEPLSYALSYASIYARGISS